MRYRDVLFIIFSIALTVFLLVCAFRGGHMIFDNLEKDREQSARIEQAYKHCDRYKNDKDFIFSACMKSFGVGD